MATQLEYPEASGVIITGTTPLGPAARRNVIRGEKLLEINGEPIETTEDVRRILGGVREGEIVSLRLGRPDQSSRIVNVRAGG